jgi:hypothetical protein
VARHHRTRIKNLDVILDRVEIDALLATLCTKLGICLPPSEQERIAATPPRDIGEFTRQVFLAERLDPSDKPLFDPARDFVEKAFVGHDTRETGESNASRS